MAFYIVTDSASDLPKDIIKEFNADVIPTPVTIDDVDYFDGDTIEPDQFYKLQAEGHDIKTYHISQLMFEEHFEKYAKNNDEVLYICFSTGIAGTFNAARLAIAELKETYPDFQITVIDSKCASLGYGMVVTKLLKMQKNGAPKELIIEAANYFCEHMVHVFTVSTLEYLYKGGRISRTSAVMGGALDIKPVIIVDEVGSLKAIEKVRGWKKVQRRIVDMVGEKSDCLDKQMIGIVYGSDEAEFEVVKKLVEEKYNIGGVLKGQIGCAIGAHTGAGIVGIIFQSEVDEKYEQYVR